MADLGPARERIAAAAARAGRDPGDVEIVAATKYVALEDFGALVEAGVTRVGENRAQDLQAKHAEYGDRFTWDFIGHVQSRKVPQILPLVQRIHSVGSDSVLGRLERHLDLARPGSRSSSRSTSRGRRARAASTPTSWARSSSAAPSRRWA